MIEITNVVNADADPAAAAAVDQLGGLIGALSILPTTSLEQFYINPAQRSSRFSCSCEECFVVIIFADESSFASSLRSLDISNMCSCWGLVLTREDRRIESTDMEKGQHVQLVYSSPVDK
ncbi:hypothetical protein E3P88_03909 [Wallemia ichthyophaga]|uniref:Uncharacterized protein n=1 Tax=Wallemia ichthyophaga TaxID=245174 RepID=A0A4T0GX26_WALIC|nr:hypothetical protein E3P96_01303 [Wallemia ichthyophaga]TIB07278.1 hypothetical protein E3P93_03919 [Wallemia ichthyophaga]TIB07779.1 hypothetical protein E3P90_03922 [Wallemia ichthyophaga]TIB20479.1 hypothetical protein E3P88_03909 [Wallemia ichthyophaga]